MRWPTLGTVLLAGLVSVTAAPVVADELPVSPRSVYHVDPGVDGMVSAAAAITNLVPYLWASKLIVPRCPCDPAEVNALDRHVIGNHNVFLDSTSDVTVGAAVLVPPVLDALDLGWSRALAEDWVIFEESLSIAGGFATLAKYAVQRPLPRVYAGQAPELIHEPGGYRSFYSGHTTLAFAALTSAAVTLDFRYGASPWPWVVAGAVGTSVAIERVAAGRHFYSDVLVGAMTGIAVGALTPALHARSETLGRIAREFSVSPAGTGISLRWRRDF